MTRLRDLPIKQKLTVIIMITSASALLLASGIFLVNEWYSAREAAARHLAIQARILGTNSTAALAFDDTKTAQELLSSLQASPDIISAAIFTKGDEPFATYIRSGEAQRDVPENPLSQGHRFIDSGLEVFQPIVLENETIGTVYLRSDLRQVQQRLWNYGTVVVLVIAGSLLVAFLIAARIQRSISEPVLKLTDTARSISERQDYSIRAVKTTRDEVGTLIESFNEMLSQIQLRDRQLEHHREELESQVAQRTAELSESNVRLTEEIAERKETESRLQQAHAKVASWADELEHRNQEARLLSEMAEFLQASRTREEAYPIIDRYVQQLFPTDSGAVFVFRESENFVEAASYWGTSPLGKRVFSPDDCWALRRGRPYMVDNFGINVLCEHVSEQEDVVAYICAPMVAQGEALGVFHLLIGPTKPEWSHRHTLQAKEQLARITAEHIGLALINLKLREALHDQSIRDPLTGLFNRRYMEETLRRELDQARRKDTTLGVIMIDIDHFKRINDDYGHEAGDVVLRELGRFFNRYIREGDIACRYGGEEFTLILPETSMDILHQRAEMIREASKLLRIYWGEELLGPITLSLGLAVFPDHGNTAEMVLKAADAGLYRAKAEGRDRVVVMSST